MKKAIIVGASSGIGQALALRLAESGYTVSICGRRTKLLEKLQTLHPGHIHISTVDVTEEGLTSKLDELAKSMGGMDLFIFSAGIGELNPTLELSLELPTVEVNVNAFNEAVVWAYQHFERQKGGHIVNISSIAGLRGGGIAPAYNASKAYQINYLEGLRQKARKQRSKIVITDARPGFVATAMMKSPTVFWVSTPEKAALQIHDAIKAKKNVIYVSKRWRMIAWLLKIMPCFLYERM